MRCSSTRFTSRPSLVAKRRDIARRMSKLTIALMVALGAVLAAMAPVASADGDPGSDVLVYQPLFLAADAGISVQQQARLGALLHDAARHGLPIRVAIIATRSDLGAVTGLWRKPRAYARFLGVELSLAYKGRLLVVMPNGYGFNWPGHSAAAAYRTLRTIAIRPGARDLATAAQTGVGALAAANRIKLGSATATAGRARSHAARPASQAAGPHGTSDEEVLILGILAALCVLALTVHLVPRWRGHGGSLRSRLPRPGTAAIHGKARRGLVVGGLGIAAAVVVVILSVGGSPSEAQSDALARNPSLDPGTSLARSAPNFTLTDQFGKPASLRSFRGKVVLLAFNDSECTTVCPLTTSAMVEAKAMLGPAAKHVELLGVDANPKATALEDVLSYSQLHGMLHSWRFLTGSLAALHRVWSAYGIQAAVQGGEIAHTPALFVIDPLGRERKLYMTQQSYAAVDQLGELLAQEASHLLPGHPAVRSKLSYAQIKGIAPTAKVRLPRAGSGSVALGPGRPHLYLFFATWDQEVTSLAAHLEGLSRYQAATASSHLPALTGIDEASVEPSPDALKRFLGTLAHPLPYPVALDRSGRVADGYEVQGQPWFVLTSPTGRILWYRQVTTGGWPRTDSLIQTVRTALRHAPRTSAAAATRELTGSPPALTALHRQAGRLLGTEPALAARIRALRGYPIVLNAWASWCTPCRAESALLGAASAAFGRRVAFLGADTNDSASDASSFLAQHPVSYPSYQTSITALSSIVPAGLAGLPTTVFINRAGKIVDVHVGQYDSLGTLEADIQTYARGR